MKTRYYVSYVRETGTGVQFGAVEVLMEKPIRNTQDIQVLREYLASSGYRGATVLSFCLLGDTLASTPNA